MGVHSRKNEKMPQLNINTSAELGCQHEIGIVCGAASVTLGNPFLARLCLKDKDMWCSITTERNEEGCKWTKKSSPQVGSCA